jgi:tyrosyl-tRNA synthetase
LLTDVSLAEVSAIRQKAASGAVNPMSIKMDLARRIVSDFHSQEQARQAEDEFHRVVQRHQQPQEVETRSIAVSSIAGKSDGPAGPNQPVKLDRLLATVGLASSVSEAARKLKEGAVTVNGERCKELFLHIDTSRSQELLLKMGRRHVRVLLESR